MLQICKTPIKNHNYDTPIWDLKMVCVAISMVTDKITKIHKLTTVTLLCMHTNGDYNYA